MANRSEPIKNGASRQPSNLFLPFTKAEIEQSIPDRFEQQAKLYPNRVAIAGRGKLLSYCDLNRIANRIAWALIEFCGEAQGQVALLLEPGELIVAAILGVLKAGQIYVPLDPSGPTTRNQFILRHAEVSLILTNNRNFVLATELAGSNVRLINLDHLEANLSIENVGKTISPDAIAYIIYTSGSTGQPKGVVETHRNLLHNVMRNTNTLWICREDRVSLLRSIGAGGAARDALSALLNGAALCPFSVKENGLEALAAWLMKQEISIFTTVITVFRHLGAILSGEERFPALRIIYAGGEQVTRRDVELYKKHFSDDCLFVNRLGITETGTVAYFFIDKNSNFAGAVVPVGYPAEDTEILILDENGNETDDDTVGEIAIKSEYISPGYWKSPEITESVLLPDPSGGKKRIYCTGDFGRKLPDGCLVHLGWKDFQVNIRGYRIEVVEVETELLNHPGVLEAAVVGREHPSAEIRLAAAVVPVQKDIVSPQKLRSFLRGRLPDYMIPSAFMMLEALPSGPNGKIDRRALPMPEWLPDQDAGTVVGARTEMEGLIVGIWATTLGLDFVGIHDNFFDLGGHSLLLGQVMSKLQTALGVDIPLDSFLEEPTIAVLAEIVQKALETDLDNIPPLSPVSRAQDLRLSFAQERIWFLHQLEPNNFSYNFSTATLVEGPLEANALERALNEVIRRHEALRTAVTVSDEKPVQVITPELQLSLPVVDLLHLTKSASTTEVLRSVAEFAQQPFNLSTAPLFRALLLKLKDNGHVFITVHHLIADAWSIGILFNEISMLYQQYMTQEPARLPELPIQYADFAAWQREWLQGKRLESEVSYWNQQLGDKLPAGDLPSDRQRPARQSFRGGRRAIVLPKHLTTAIKHLSRRESVTPYMLLLGAFKALLFRYTGQEDVVVGSPITGRARRETQNLIGLFTNTLVLRTDFTGHPNFLELLKRVRETCLKAYAHQDFPFEKLVEELQPQRDLGRNPLFQVMFILQNTPNPVLTLNGVTTQRLEVDSGTSKFDLTLSLAEHNEQLVGSFEYSSDLFDGSTIERMAGHYQTLLGGIVADPNRPVSELPIMTEAEREQLLIEWNRTAADYPSDKCISQLFEEQVARTPDAIAVAFEGRQLAYRELNARANQLASYLIGLGVGRGKLVGICVERSLGMVLGLLGILKAGAAYVPLDPTYPAERLRFMVQDAQLSVVLTTEELIANRGWRPVLSQVEGMEDCNPRFSILDSRPTVCLDRDWPVIERQNAENPQTGMRAEDLAYVIYTSGSTGKPKGVQVLHRPVVNCLYSIGERLGFTDRDVFLALTTISFDISILELFLPLFFGAKVVVASREEAADGRELARRLASSSATALQATPWTWRLLIEAGWEGSQGFKILCGGESMSRELAEALVTRGEVWNVYGPTESTIWATVHRVEPVEGPVPIGRPIANTKIYILDSHLQPVPIGVHGELCIGGDGLARGYRNRPELTAEQFIPNPFVAGERLYKTGDRARYRPDGDIEFIGRLDNQVKIRGYRVELGEIEVALSQHPAVRQCVVVARARDPLLEQSLIGYIVPEQKPAPSVTELRDYLKEKLPDYMIPAAFVTLEALPRTPNGKIDRNALPSPDGARPQLEQGYIEPRTEIEELVAQVWREVLKLDKIGANDNFFELGGHSLLATRVVARLRNNFALDLPLRKLFELPTVAALAEHIDGLLHNQSGTPARRIVPIPRDHVLPASFSQQRLWFLRELDPESTAYNISAVFSIRGVLNFSALEEAFNAIITRHEIFRTTFAVVEGTLVQKIQTALRISLPIVDLGSLSESAWNAAARKIALDEARQPFDLRKGPLLRPKLLQSGEEQYYLLLNFDHTVLDGWSMGTFFRELGILYEAFAGRQANPLPPPALQYADYAVWQREFFHGDVSESQLQYWKRQVGDRFSPLILPTDYPRPAVKTSHGIRRSLTLSKQLSNSLKELSRREGVTLFMTLLAGFKILLSRHGGQDDIVIGATIAGRSRPEIEGVIGFFINALPLRTDLSGNPSFLELSKRVREVCLGAYTHQDAPFERIVEAINPRRDFSRNPLFQIMFNMADVSERVLQFAGCEVRKESFFDPEAKFDITLYASETDGLIELAMVYNADLFSESRIATILDQFAYLLAQIAEKPQARIGEYGLVLPSTRALLPDPTESLDDSWEGAIHELFSEHARITPEKLVVVDADDAWTYRELDQRSTQLANYLVAGGIRPKDIVAIYAHRSSPLVLALLGVLKAGAAFVILDPAYPPARLLAYLSIARPKGWIKMAAAGELSGDLANGLETLKLSCRLNLPKDKQAIADFLTEQPETETHVAIRANDPAYIAFTSGSTGQPKGVLGRHGPVTHFLPWQTEAFALRETDRFCLLSGLAYNHLQRDVFTPLSLGATLYVPPGEVARSPEPLSDWLRANLISVLHLIPALGQLLLTAGTEPLPAVRRVFFGGDVLTAGLVAEFRRVAPNAIIGSFYGATETQRAVGYYEIPSDFETDSRDGNRPITLGRGIKDVQLLLLNRAGQLAGVGELGELYVRSPHLAEGYIGDDELTAQTFVKNPFTNDPKDRLYRTGELGRYLPDGHVEWAGRNDRRVNIRGFRVELEEIETSLKQHPIVKSAAVVTQDYEIPPPENPKPETRNPKLDQRLVAYVVADEGGDSIVDLLRSFLSTRLPDYMVPAHFVISDQLPLSPNGKVDYRALPSVRQIHSNSSSPIVSPRNEVETKLCAIFCQVLGREQVGIEENFFRLGGHSLLAAQTAARIREAVGVSLELRTFLESPTVAALAKEIQFRIKAANTTPSTRDRDREEIEL